MNGEEYRKVQAKYELSGFPGLCDRQSAECSPSTLATKIWSQNLKAGIALASTSTSDDEEFYLYCDFHAPKNAVELHPSKIDQLVAPDAHDSSSESFAKLRSKLNKSYGIRKSTGDAPDAELIIFQTQGASPENPILAEFTQHILTPFTGAGQFDLVERDAIRRVTDGASAGGTAVLGSETMNWQPEDAGQSIKVGLNPGRHYGILSVEDPEHVTLSGDITLPSSELVLTMDGDEASAVTIATKAGFADGVTTGAHSRLSKALTVDKIYRVVFVPGPAGDGNFSIIPRALYHTEPVPNPEVQ